MQTDLQVLFHAVRYAAPAIKAGVVLDDRRLLGEQRVVDRLFDAGLIDVNLWQLTITAAGVEALKALES